MNQLFQEPECEGDYEGETWRDGKMPGKEVSRESQALTLETRAVEEQSPW